MRKYICLAWLYIKIFINLPENGNLGKYVKLCLPKNMMKCPGASRLISLLDQYYFYLSWVMGQA